MKNYELLREIYGICMTADCRDEGHTIPEKKKLEQVIDLIEKERGEIALLDKWVEMEKYPHQDNHMD